METHHCLWQPSSAKLTLADDEVHVWRATLDLPSSPVGQLGGILTYDTREWTSQLDRPFAFFGHSLGALVSFELIRLVRGKFGLSPVHLFISGYRAPHLPNPDLPVHQLPSDKFEMQLRRLHGTPEEVLQDKELMQIMIPLLRADFAVHETYSYLPSAPLDCPISVFGGWNDDHASYEELDLWRQHTRNRFNLKMFDGDHFFLRNARSNLLNSISQELAQFL